MAFTGKCTFSSNLTEIAEDVSDLVSILAPSETPLLDILGDAPRPATSTRHEWLEDSLLPNRDAIAQSGLNDASRGTLTFGVATSTSFRVGDLVQQENEREIMMVTTVDNTAHTITVTRAYGNTPRAQLVDGGVLRIISNAALEGQEAAAARFSVRARRSNFTQIFSAPIQISGTEMAVRQVAIADELDYQKTLRLRELLRDLENTVINGVKADVTPEGSVQARRTMGGLIAGITANVLPVGHPALPDGSALTEEMLNAALRSIWEKSGSKIDLIVCGGAQKRRINNFIASSQRFSTTGEVFKNMVSAYESDYGVCRVALSRYVPQNMVLLLDSSRISVVPLAGRSFHYKPLASGGDYVSGELIGEYTLEFRNQSAHGYISGLDA